MRRNHLRVSEIPRLLLVPGGRRQQISFSQNVWCRKGLLRVDFKTFSGLRLIRMPVWPTSGVPRGAVVNGV